jgi:hypothetical protein
MVLMYTLGEMVARSSTLKVTIGDLEPPYYIGEAYGLWFIHQNC